MICVAPRNANHHTSRAAALAGAAAGLGGCGSLTAHEPPPAGEPADRFLVISPALATTSDGRWVAVVSAERAGAALR